MPAEEGIVIPGVTDHLKAVSFDQDLPYLVLR